MYKLTNHAFIPPPPYAKWHLIHGPQGAQAIISRIHLERLVVGLDLDVEHAGHQSANGHDFALGEMPAWAGAGTAAIGDPGACHAGCGEFGFGFGCELELGFGGVSLLCLWVIRWRIPNW